MSELGKGPLRPNYYKGSDGHDIFWEMEHGEYPYEWCIGFCYFSEKKYWQRLGKKTKDKTKDMQKAWTYRHEREKLEKLHKEGQLK